MTSEMKTQLCREDFYLMLKCALHQAGGGSSVDTLKNSSLNDVVNLLAQNGIRMVFIPDKHIDSLKVVWGAQVDPTPNVVQFPSGRREDGPLPKRRQLLCDQVDNDEHPDDDYDTKK
jgi:hypothetical protein